MHHSLYIGYPACPVRRRAPLPGGTVIRTRRAVASGITAVVTMAALAACGDAPESSTAATPGDDTSSSAGGGGESSPAVEGFLPCIVSDAGGFDDKSFNQLSYEGV